MKPAENRYSQLIDNIGITLQNARQNAFKAINTELVKANWEIGRHIVEFEQRGKEKAEYGSALLTNLSRDLKVKYGAGFSKSTIYLCRLFYIKYPKFQTVSGKSGIRQALSGKSSKNQTPSGIFLSWSHYSELVG